MRFDIVCVFHVLTLYTCLANYENCSDCETGHICCKGICRPCFSCQLYLRRGGSCVCGINECGTCLKGYEEVSKTKYSFAPKVCRIVRPTDYFTVKCRNDGNCPKDKYCFGGTCVPCLDCKLYHREQSRIFCPKYPSDCGSCIEGYLETPVTHNSKLKSCYYRSGHASYTLLTEHKLLYVLVIVVMGSVICTAFFMSRNRKDTFSSNISGFERPFSHTPASASISCEEETIFTYVKEEKEKSNVAARVRSSSESEYRSSSDEVPNSPSTPISYDDEETIPSSWTPNASIETRDNINTNSFSGIINRIRETSLTERCEEREKSDNLMRSSDSSREIFEIESATQEIHIDEAAKS